MVILYERLNEQEHYVEHENALSSLAVSQGSLIASGEKGENPRIHLWDVHTLKTIHVFQNDHKADVYLLEFIKNDKYLASCSLRTNTPVVVYDVNTRTVVFSYWVDELVRQVVPIFTDIQKFGESRDPTHMYREKNFILLSKYKAYYIKQNELQSIVGLQNMRRFESLTEITAGISYLQKHVGHDGRYTGRKDNELKKTMSKRGRRKMSYIEDEGEEEKEKQKVEDEGDDYEERISEGRIY